jgi:hypothetical protein
MPAIVDQWDHLLLKSHMEQMGVVPTTQQDSTLVEVVAMNTPIMSLVCHLPMRMATRDGIPEKLPVLVDYHTARVQCIIAMEEYEMHCGVMVWLVGPSSSKRELRHMVQHRHLQ